VFIVTYIPMGILINREAKPMINRTVSTRKWTAYTKNPTVSTKKWTAFTKNRTVYTKKRTGSTINRKVSKKQN
jgi:hypothetical protein